MKRLILGTALILYAMFLTPAFFEPTDLVISSGWLAIATSMGIPTLIVALWMASGYIAVVLGAVFIGAHIFKKFGPVGMLIMKNPIGFVAVASVITGIVCWIVIEYGL